MTVPGESALRAVTLERFRIDVERWLAETGRAPTSPSTCSRCGLGVLWATTARGRRIPLNPEPNLPGRGNFVITNGVARYVLDSRREQLRADGRDIWESHFATCAAAKRAARRRGRSA